MTLAREYLAAVTRRHFLQQCHVGLGGLALSALLGDPASAAPAAARGSLAKSAPHFAAKAKQVIFLHMAGGPSQLELFEPKPELRKRDGQDCPEEFLKGQRFAFIKGRPKLLGTVYDFAQYGQSGAWFSTLLPHLAGCADDLTVIRSMTTEQFNHAPAQLLMHTGNQVLGHASMGAWVTYGLGTLNRESSSRGWPNGRTASPIPLGASVSRLTPAIAVPQPPQRF